MKPRVVVARRMPRAVMARIQQEFTPVLAETAELNAEALVSHLPDCDAHALLITSDIRLTGDIISRIPSCIKIVATCSVGFEHMDVAAAKARGLILTNTPEVVTDCTADLTFLLILGACRRATEYSTIMRDGWRNAFGWDEMLGVQVSNKTLGIVGLGRIGRAVAQRARGFGMKILYTDVRRLPPEMEQGARYCASLRELLPLVQILTLHAPAGPGADKIMNAEAFALLPKGAVFVNAARSRLVDEEALLGALTSGHLYAAGLDVFDKEPGCDPRFIALPNVFLTPHAGTSTVETRNAMGFRALDNIAAVCAGMPPIDPLW